MHKIIFKNTTPLSCDNCGKYWCAQSYCRPSSKQLEIVDQTINKKDHFHKVRGKNIEITHLNEGKYRHSYPSVKHWRSPKIKNCITRASKPQVSHILCKRN